MRRHGLKDAARYFGFASSDREYVPGAEIWPTYRTDPDRIRRYAADDVDEVDGLSRRLLPPVFGLTRYLPRSYERIAADTGAASLWELLLVRALSARGSGDRRARAARAARRRGAARSELFVAGLLGRSVRAVARPLLPCVLVDRAIAAANDELRLMPRLLRAPAVSSRRAVRAAAGVSGACVPGQPGPVRRSAGGRGCHLGRARATRRAAWATCAREAARSSRWTASN